MKTASIFDDKNLAFCLLLSVFLLFPDIPLWAFSSSLIFWFYRLILDRSAWRIPSRWITGFFSVIFMAITYFSYKTLIGREASCAFLVVLLSLKILEYQQTNERGFLILLGIYLFISKFLFDTDFIWFSIGFPAMILLVYYLLPDIFRKRNPKAAGIFILQSLLLAAPLGLFLFFYFPRFSSDIFNFQNNENKSANIGFTDDIQPGSVASLAQNDEMAFRAEFINVKPSINSMYWRGSVLTQVEGLRWQKDPGMVPSKKVFTTIDPEDSQIQITLEPNYKHWLFTLDQTSGVTSNHIQVLSGPMGVFKSSSYIDKRIVYNIKANKSLTRPRENNETSINIHNPPSAKIKSLLANLSMNAKSPDDLVSNISEYLVKNQFQYTLEPGDNGILSLDDFLFKTKKGFCEHFASTSAILLNYLKVPTRIVVGYHGGEFNPIGKFWTIRQQDAHAWTEYLDRNNEWHRFDPTAVIAPLRIALGANVYEKIQVGAFDPDQLKALTAEDRNSGLLLKFQFFLEDLNYRWNFMFVNFDIDKQKEILHQMDINLGLAILLGMLFTLTLSLLLSWLFRVRQKVPRSKRIFNLINTAMEDYSLEKGTSEGIIAWRDRLIKAFPDKSKEFSALIECYLAEAYQNNKSRENFKRAKQILSKIS